MGISIRMQMRHKILEKPVACLEVNPYKALGSVICQLRSINNKKVIRQEDLGDNLNLSRQRMGEIECGSRKLDLFEVKDIASFFSRRSPAMAKLKLVLDTYFPKGNHNTAAIHKETGILIYEARTSVGMNRHELARETGIGVTSLWRIETGDARIYLLEVWAIAKVLREYEAFKELDDALSDLLVTGKSNQFIAL